MEKKEKKLPLIVNQNKREEPDAKPVPYKFGADSFARYSNAKNPFVGQVLPKEGTLSKVDPHKMQSLFHHAREIKQYQVKYPTDRVPHSRRKIVGTQEQSPPQSSVFHKKDLKENTLKLEASIQTFFRHVLARLQNEPNDLPLVVNELIPLFLEFQVKIKIYDAFRTFYSIEQFLETLSTIAEGNDLENFEMFCSAIFGFYSQFQ